MLLAAENFLFPKYHLLMIAILNDIYEDLQGQKLSTEQWQMLSIEDSMANAVY